MISNRCACRSQKQCTQAAVLSLLLCSLICVSCSVKFVSDYDEALDSQVTALHTKIETFLIKMGEESGTKAGEYDSNLDFYAETEAQISTIKMRAESTPKNELTTKQVTGLESTFNKLEVLHKKEAEAGLKPNLIAPIRSAFDSECTAITTLELAKKRGQ
jgi:hypothetical protein